jgi:hypothetical protein
MVGPKNHLVFLLIVLRLLVPARIVPSSPIFATLMMGAIRSYEDSIIHSHRRQRLKSYVTLLSFPHKRIFSDN